MQLLGSIISVRSKIFEHHIVVVEGSRYTDAQRFAVVKAGAADVYEKMRIHGSVGKR